MSDLLGELERIVERARPRPGAFDRWERRMRRRRIRERVFAGTIAAAVVAATALAYLQLSRARPTPGTVAPPRQAVEGIFETRVTRADLLAIPEPSPMFSPRDADFLRLGTGRLRLVLERGVYQLIFYQDRRGPLYLRNEGTYPGGSQARRRRVRRPSLAPGPVNRRHAAPGRQKSEDPPTGPFANVKMRP